MIPVRKRIKLRKTHGFYKDVYGRLRRIVTGYELVHFRLHTEPCGLRFYKTNRICWLQLRGS